MAQLWPAQRGAPTLVRHETSSLSAHVVSSPPALMALPVRTKDRPVAHSIFIQCVILPATPRCFFEPFYEPNKLGTSLGHLPFHQPSTPPPPPPFPSSSFSFPSPSQVEMMYDSCCQLLYCVSCKLIMTKSSLYFASITPSLSLSS